MIWLDGWPMTTSLRMLSRIPELRLLAIGIALHKPRDLPGATAMVFLKCTYILEVAELSAARLGCSLRVCHSPVGCAAVSLPVWSSNMPDQGYCRASDIIWLLFPKVAGAPVQKIRRQPYSWNLFLFCLNELLGNYQHKCEQVNYHMIVLAWQMN